MIHFDRVSFWYPDAPAPALEDVSFRIEPGTVTLVTGPAGSGCSTLLLIAAGVAPRLTGGRLTGKVTTPGTEPGSDERRAGFLLPTPWTQLSGISYRAWEEVAFGPANLGWPRDRITASVDRAMELAGVTHLADRDPATLSGGELQRVILAGIIAMEPAVFLFDEPTIELDPAGSAAFYQLTRSLARTASVVVATTEVDHAVAVADQVLLLAAGRLVAKGPAEAVLGSKAAVELGIAPAAALLAHRAGLRPPYPIAPAPLAARVGG